MDELIVEIEDILSSELRKFNIQQLETSLCKECNNTYNKFPVPIDLILPNYLIASGWCCSYKCLEQFCAFSKFNGVNKYWNSVDILFSILPIII